MREDLREIGPHVMIAPPAVLGGHVLGAPGEDRRRGTRQAPGHAGGPRPRRSGRPRASWPRGARRGWRALRRLAHLLAFRTMLDKLGLSRVRYAYTGGAPLGAGDLHLLPGHRTQPQAGLRADGVRRHLRGASGRRGARGDGGQAHAGHARPHLGRRRDPHRQRQRLPRLLQERRGHGARPSTAGGSAPATPA